MRFEQAEEEAREIAQTNAIRMVVTFNKYSEYINAAALIAVRPE